MSEFLKNILSPTKVRWTISVSERVVRVRRGPLMARQAHLEAARHHLEAASVHLEVANKYRDGESDAAERDSAEAWAASRIADGKSIEAHGELRPNAGLRKAGRDEVAENPFSGNHRLFSAVGLLLKRALRFAASGIATMEPAPKKRRTSPIVSSPRWQRVLAKGTKGAQQATPNPAATKASLAASFARD
jgi:hypothetical protein